MRKLLASLGVRVRCEPNWIVRASATPDDPDYPQQYASSFLSLPAAWDLTTGSDASLVVVIDSGVQHTHPDLAANMWINPNEIAGNGIDDDANGYIDDIHGVNVRNGTGDPNDDNGHGTHCAGILGARGNNTIGIAGVAWRTQIVGAKFLSNTGSGSIAGAIAAINYSRTLKLAGHNVVASNNSWGGGSFSASLYSSIQQSINAGILFVAAAGNSSQDNDVALAYPASYDLDGILAVASTDATGALSSFSNYGAATVDIAAPGSNIRSCITGSSYTNLSGTSMAAPQVSGIALLMQAICNRSLTVTQVKETILSSGVTNANLTGKVVTGAIANAAGAVTAANNYCNPTPTPTATPTETPVDTPTPEPTPTSTPEPPAPTLTPEAGNGPSPSTFEVRLAPSSALEPLMQLRIQVAHPGSAKSASLQIRGVDTIRRSHSCKPVRIRLEDGRKTIAMQLPDAIRHFRTLTVAASAGQATARDRVSIARPVRAKNLRQAQQLFGQLCSALEQAIG